MDDPRFTVRHADLDADGAALRVNWNDGHASVYPLGALRACCPCANCRNERATAHESPFRLLPQGAERAHILAGAEPTGSYGMKLTWADGHSTGIYSWEYLRRNCPCPACRSELSRPDGPAIHGIAIPG